MDDVDRGRSDERREEEVLLATSGVDDVDVLRNETLVNVLNAVVVVRVLHAVDRLNTLNAELLVGDLMIV